MGERLVRVEAPHFVAGIIVGEDRVVRWVIGKPPAEVSAYFKRKGWQARFVRSMTDPGRG